MKKKEKKKLKHTHGLQVNAMRELEYDKARVVHRKLKYANNRSPGAQRSIFHVYVYKI